MKQEYTFSMIKPDAIKKNIVGSIHLRFQQAKFKISSIKMIKLNNNQAINFYFEHKKKLFFNELIKFITSGPVIVQVLSGENIIQNLRRLIGATNPKEAISGTLRSDFSNSIIENTIHASNSKESANKEINFFFKKEEIY